MSDAGDRYEDILARDACLPRDLDRAGYGVVYNDRRAMVLMYADAREKLRALVEAVQAVCDAHRNGTRAASVEPLESALAAARGAL